MNLLQKQYGLKINIQKDSQRYNIENYFNTIEAIRSRPTQFITYPKNCFIKKISQEPYKDIFVIQSNRKMRLRLESIRNKPVIPKINNEYLELEERMKNNRDKIRELNNKVLTIENERFMNRVFSQRPRIINVRSLGKLYEDNIEPIKSTRNRRNSNNALILPKITNNNLHHKTEANIDSDNENSNNNSLDLKDHGHKEISHQRQGHITG